MIAGGGITAESGSLVLATRMIGQAGNLARLRQWRDSMPGNSYIFAGAKGSGRRSLARVWAQQLLCEDGTGCGRCRSCRLHYRFSHPDCTVFEADPDSSLIPVARVRSEISGDILTLPTVGERRVFIIDADALNEAGQNALLKTLEEPPVWAVIILIVTVPERLLPTIRSRCVLLRMEPYTAAEVEAIVATLPTEGGTKERATDTTQLWRRLDAGQRKFLLNLTDNSPGQIIPLITDGDFGAIYNGTRDVFRTLLTGGLTDLLVDCAAFFKEQRDSLSLIFQLLAARLRDFMLFAAVAERTASEEQGMPAADTAARTPLPADKDFIFARERDEMQRLWEKQRSSTLRIGRALSLLNKAETAIANNAGFDIAISNLLLQLRKELTNAHSG